MPPSVGTPQRKLEAPSGSKHRSGTHQTAEERQSDINSLPSVKIIVMMASEGCGPDGSLSRKCMTQAMQGCSLPTEYSAEPPWKSTASSRALWDGPGLGL
jgi:hypothetical protein